MIIEESGMSFQLPDDSTYLIESSQLYISLMDNLKIAEFIVFFDFENEVCQIIEAKSSSPQPGNIENFESFINDICEKFINSFNLLLANRFKRHGNNKHKEMPVKFQSFNFTSTGYKFVLIINNHLSEWLPPLNDSLKIKLKQFVKAFNIPDSNIKVLNDKLAREIGYLKNSTIG